jgi:hypothetical protein
MDWRSRSHLTLRSMVYIHKFLELTKWSRLTVDIFFQSWENKVYGWSILIYRDGWIMVNQQSISFWLGNLWPRVILYFCQKFLSIRVRINLWVNLVHQRKSSITNGRVIEISEVFHSPIDVIDCRWSGL